MVQKINSLPIVHPKQTEYVAKRAKQLGTTADKLTSKQYIKFANEYATKIGSEVDKSKNIFKSLINVIKTHPKISAAVAAALAAVGIGGKILHDKLEAKKENENLQPAFSAMV